MVDKIVLLMLISVITVSYNSAGRIERTIRSIIQQDFCNFEYIVIDGGSNDGTDQIIKKYEKSIAYWVSEPDSGIYNAMNKAVRKASGDYCIFMNAGDTFYSSTVLSEVAEHLDGKSSIVMGNQIFLSANGRFSQYGRHWDEVTPKRLFFDSLYHQASFIRRSDLMEFPYDESLKMVSDWKEALELLLAQNKEYRGIDVDVDFFFQDGVTETNRAYGNRERQIILNQYFSEEQQRDFRDEMMRYKSLWNISRYFNHFRDSMIQMYKRVTVNKPSLLMER